jgi:hypothetical protein
MHQGSDNQNGYDSDQGRTQRAPTIPGATGRPAGDTNDQAAEKMPPKDEERKPSPSVPHG